MDAARVRRFAVGTLAALAVGGGSLSGGAAGTAAAATGTTTTQTQPVASFLGKSMGFGFLASCGVAGTCATLFAMQATDMQQAQTIFTQVQADAQKQRAERWRILQDTQTRIFQLTQDVTVNRARTQDRAFNAMDQYIRR
jgi:hypothetical protein